MTLRVGKRFAASLPRWSEAESSRWSGRFTLAPLRDRGRSNSVEIDGKGRAALSVAERSFETPIAPVLASSTEDQRRDRRRVWLFARTKRRELRRDSMMREILAFFRPIFTQMVYQKVILLLSAKVRELEKSRSRIVISPRRKKACGPFASATSAAQREFGKQSYTDRRKDCPSMSDRAKSFFSLG